MASLMTSVRITGTLHQLCVCASRALASTSAMPSNSIIKDEAKEVIVNYLDGKDNGIAVIGLNRPAARNSFGKSLVSQLNETLATVRQNNKLRVLILRSLVPKVFCAGADLRERLKMNSADVPLFVSSLRSLISDVETLPTPVISAIDGVALGGGLELALATDIRVASTEAKMGLVETRLAIIPGGGGTQRLPRIVGVAKAKELIYTARILDGDEALQIGLVNEVVPQNKTGDAAYQAALSIAREILPNGPIGVRLAKVAISEGSEVSLKDGLEVERQCYSKIVDTKDRIEGLAAFAAKRAPVYQGI
ncbi:methylglutaconyl-CoA hydratase, mitochondrial [Odontomachus brunneus]|uniref:methylglutaconyl-CoA hydratase, mitochondrial n=1 Tax=Odontomachus brunneus TaxID=486640 RepID=UPI0013F22A4C|nr:methylglutaconyl-CoA hydratase, mitochondrial [Odontomachus brunneus]XP_032669147.1 methylglutaconyl-CoA hydratase, mitochondrial [Odontomachus brunneus]XP_032669148.1 methylglutaconyl-CoA hydratase, mitochondrial [Odontomachus brunneus]XP_032669149.1 methylglutaconyl-CoA hydratase, mitochondrial [Odontomachus brunneus]